MIGAIRPPYAFIPMRNWTESFSTDSSTYYDSRGAGDDVYPPDNPTGRDNNHDFEGFTVDGNNLYALVQAAANHEGGLNKQTECYARLVKYDITIPSARGMQENSSSLPHCTTTLLPKHPRTLRLLHNLRFSTSKMGSSLFCPETQELVMANLFPPLCTAKSTSLILLLQRT